MKRSKDVERGKKSQSKQFPQLEVIIKTAGAVFTAPPLGFHFVY